MTTITTDVVQFLRPTTLADLIYDLQPYAKHYGELLTLVNAATRELVNNAGEEDARTMLAERGLVVLVSFTVQAKGE